MYVRVCFHVSVCAMVPVLLCGLQGLSWGCQVWASLTELCLATLFCFESLKAFSIRCLLTYFCLFQHFLDAVRLLLTASRKPHVKIEWDLFFFSLWIKAVFLWINFSEWIYVQASFKAKLLPLVPVVKMFRFWLKCRSNTVLSWKICRSGEHLWHLVLLVQAL